MNFRKVLSWIDVAPLLDQLSSTDLWSTDTEWTRKKHGTAVYHIENIVLRYVTLGMGEGRRLYLFEDERGRDDWTRPAGRVITGAWPIVFDLARAVWAEHIGHVIITRMHPGAVIEPHIDQGPPIPGLPYWRRYQVPLQADEGVVFRCGGENLHMTPGDAYWFDNQKPHSVRNDSSRDRLSMIVELRPMFPEGF